MVTFNALLWNLLCSLNRYICFRDMSTKQSHFITNMLQKSNRLVLMPLRRTALVGLP